MTKRANLVVLFLTVAGLSGCALGQYGVETYNFPGRIEVEKQDKPLDLVGRWFEDPEGLEKRANRAVFEGRPVPYRFILAEESYWSGDVERAFERYLSILETHPESPLNRYVAARLYELRDDVTDYESRMRPVLDSTEYRALTPLARSYLAYAARDLAQRKWRISDSRRPFNGDSIGYPWNWMVTPRLSPWRLSDFDLAFEPEHEAGLSGRFLAPYFAENLPLNRESRRPYLAGGGSLAPGFEKDGIYYLETFIEVTGKESSAYWLVSDFTSRTAVWIDGKRVFKRSEKEYGGGKRFRRVELSPGQHRVLVKLGYESGYRDWFDLMFLRLGATPLSGSKLEFSRVSPVGADASRKTRDNRGIELKSRSLRPGELEPVRIPKKESASDYSSMALYLSAVGAFFGREPAKFDRLWSLLMERHPNFSPSIGLHSQYVQTLWEMPSNRRQSEAHSDLREANDLDGDSLFYLTRLIRRLRQNSDRSPKVERLLKKAREEAIVESDQGRRLRNIEPFEQWASYLTTRGWGSAAKNAWQKVLAYDPGNCRAASQLYRHKHSNYELVELDEITPRWRECPDLYRTVVMNHPGWEASKPEYIRRMSDRYPFRSGWQLNFVNHLVQSGKHERARQAVRAALNRLPESVSIWQRRVELALLEGGESAAISMLKEAMERIGRNGLFTWMLAELTAEIPLQGLLKDGRKVARTEASKRDESDIRDDAYYAIDYAARKYFQNGDSVLLTHYMIRVMSKEAINNYGEVSLPNDARPILVRTVKEDGHTEVPEQSSGKQTLSMPDLSKGDFIEVAYLQYRRGSDLSVTRRNGTRFFFRMSDISSIHSEYNILNPLVGTVFRANNAPEKRRFSVEGESGYKFVEHKTIRPPAEPYTVPWTDYLPWVQLYHSGISIPNRQVQWKAVANRVENGLKQSYILENRVRNWLQDVPSAPETKAKELFYNVLEELNSFRTSSGFGEDATHTLLTGEGNALVLLKAVYDAANIESEIYLVWDKLVNQTRSPLSEFGAYRQAVLRVEFPGEQIKWVNPRNRYAMFNAVSLTLPGQPAVCISCSEIKERQLPGLDAFRSDTRDIDISGVLSEEGELKANIVANYGGIRANIVRQRLAQKRGSGNEIDYIRRVVGEALPGASVQNYNVVNRRNLDKPVTIQIEVKWAGFARVESDKLVLDRALFRPRIQREYAQLNRRKTPMMVNGQLDSHFSLDLQIPKGSTVVIRSKSGTWHRESKFGTFERELTYKEGMLHLESAIAMPIQRVSPEMYPAFKTWAQKISSDSVVWVNVDRGD